MSPTIEEQAKKFQNRRLADHVYELLPEPDADVELVFFHGLQMLGSPAEHSFWRTWKMRNCEDCWPEMLLPEMLTEKKNLDKPSHKIKPRVLSVSYESRPNLGEDGLGTARGDEYLIAESLMYDLILGSGVELGQRGGVPVFLIGHDLGGILIKVFVMMLEAQGETRSDDYDRTRIRKFLENLNSVFFYATPQSGSEAVEKMAAGIEEKDKNQMLGLMKVLNNKTARINKAFEAYRLEETDSKLARFTTHAVNASHLTNEGGFSNVLVVPEGSARNAMNSFYTVNANHFSVCQPEGIYSSSVRSLCDQIKKEVRRARGEVVQ